MKRFLIVVGLLALVGCNGGDGPNGTPRPGKEPISPSVLAAGKKMLLDAEPAKGKGVAEVKKTAKDGDEVVVVGQVGGVVKPFTAGMAMVVLTDPSLKPAEGCDCPWDFCASDPDVLKASRATVKFVDENGKTLPVGARVLFGIQELSKVVVTGKAKRDDAGNLTILAKGVFVRKAKP